MTGDRISRRIEGLLDQANDAERARKFQDEALAISQQLGMQPLLQRVLAQRDILKA